MKPVMATACPDLESIAAYLDGRVTDPERARITEHLSSCEECYSLFTESAQTVVDVVPSRETVLGRVSEWMSGPRLAWSTAGAALATAAVVWLVAGTRFSPMPQGSELQALVAAVGTDRPVEARLSGGFAYGQMRGAVRGGSPSGRPVSPDVRIAAARSEKALAVRRTAETLHAFGLATLVTGELGRAVPLLEQAIERAPPDARVLSDLSAAYLARAARDNRHQDLERALAAADRALKVDPEFAEALFNRALALERLSLADEARAAWYDYLRVDDRSGWADEAREHAQGPRSGR
jgi:hypothetical protein